MWHCESIPLPPSRTDRDRGALQDYLAQILSALIVVHAGGDSAVHQASPLATLTSTAPKNSSKYYTLLLELQPSNAFGDLTARSTSADESHTIPEARRVSSPSLSLSLTYMHTLTHLRTRMRIRKPGARETRKTNHPCSTLGIGTCMHQQVSGCSVWFDPLVRLSLCDLSV